jgi:hypothetical protein
MAHDFVITTSGAFDWVEAYPPLAGLVLSAVIFAGAYLDMLHGAEEAATSWQILAMVVLLVFSVSALTSKMWVCLFVCIVVLGIEFALVMRRVRGRDS